MLRPITPRLGTRPPTAICPLPAGYARRSAADLATGVLLDDHVGYRFRRPGEPAVSLDAFPKIKEMIRGPHFVAVVADGEAIDFLAELGSEAVVIRPDRYILGVASSPVELQALLAGAGPRRASKRVARDPRPATVG